MSLTEIYLTSFSNKGEFPENRLKTSDQSTCSLYKQKPILLYGCHLKSKELKKYKTKSKELMGYHITMRNIRVLSEFACLIIGHSDLYCINKGENIFIQNSRIKKNTLVTVNLKNLFKKCYYGK